MKNLSRSNTRSQMENMYDEIRQKKDQTQITVGNPSVRIDLKDIANEIGIKTDGKTRKTDDLKRRIETLQKDVGSLHVQIHELDLMERRLEEEEMILKKKKMHMMETRKSLNSSRDLYISEIKDLLDEFTKIECQRTVILDYVNKTKDENRSNMDWLIHIKENLSLSKDVRHTDNNAESSSDTDDEIECTDASKEIRACSSNSPETLSSNGPPTKIQSPVRSIRKRARTRKWSVEPRAYAPWTDSEITKLLTYINEYDLWKKKRLNMNKILGDIQRKKLASPFRSGHAIRRKVHQIMNDQKSYEEFTHDNDDEV